MDTDTSVAVAGLQLTLVSVVVYQHAGTGTDAGALLSGICVALGTGLVGYAVAST
ncbi:hypothetical protein [Halobaculum limi]|uniref:hypothetical protein n=1 Tax=Halobaculum limi TaxID=3031916 RepID=UPI0024055059|nr:hypothetical protein [Halobaculum sp. YSMS11]